MDKKKLIKQIEQFKRKNILVVGDVMLDKYIWGEVSRINPEAPVQVVDVIKESFAPGGAANVANNISSLKGNAFIAGIVGDDNAKEILIADLKEKGINTAGLITDEDKPTIQKTRIIGRSQQLLRVDYEKKGYAKDHVEEKILDFISKVIDKIDAIIISDYAKGVVTKKLVKAVVRISKDKNKILVIDPKPKHKEFYKGADLLTPNASEAAEMTGIEEESDHSVRKIGKKLLEQQKSPVLITRGEKGMSLFEADGEITDIPTRAKEVYDVTGAGDSVVATLAMALASKTSLKEAAFLANYAAGVVVGKVGTSTIAIDELKQSLEDE